MNAKASLLTFLTISESNSEKVFFAYLKALDDIAPSVEYWYQGKGANGNSNFLWYEKRLKQWCVIGEDSAIELYWNELISKKELSISWHSKTQKFFIPDVEEKIQGSNIYKIEGVSSCGHSDIAEEYICKSWDTDISFLLNEQNNCEFLSGNKQVDSIKQIEPYGLFPERFLFQSLNDRICAVSYQRSIYRSLQGKRNNIAEDPIEYLGFIQADKLFRENHKIIIRDIDGNRVLGEGNIVVETGEWHVTLSEATSKGQFLIFDKKLNSFSCGEKFYLIKNVSLDTQIVHTTLKDLYERDITITGKENNLKITDTVLWDASAAPNSNQAELELSDKITDVLKSLGKKIIFNDPYFFGDFKLEAGRFTISKNQAIFINALIIAVAKAGVEEINILGNWRKAKTKIDGNQDDFLKKYEALYRSIKTSFEKSSIFKLTTFNICFSEQVFHDRYWLNGSGDIIYHISNSISGIYASRELTVVPLKDLEVLKIKPRILDRLEKSEKHNLVAT